MAETQSRESPTSNSEGREREAGSSQRVIHVKDLDPSFKYLIMKEPGGEYLSRCFACGTCTASCPVRAVDESYNPRKIIRMALLGMKEEVLKSDFIWLCSSCYTCQERCPQDVKITELMTVLKNIAMREGFVHPSYIAQAEILYNHGRLYEIGDFENKKRTKQGLPEVKEEAEEIQKLIDTTKVSKLAKKGSS